MVFTPPAWVPPLPEIPDSITVAEFMSNEKYGRYSLARARNPYTCGLMGTSYTAAEVVKRIDYLARALRSHLGFDPAEGTEWDRVVSLYSLNTIDYMPLTHAIHRLSGVVTPASAACSASELEHQLRTSGAKAIFTCVPLLDNALKAAKAVGIPNNRIFLLSMPNVDKMSSFKTLDDLIEEGKQLPELEPLKWIKGQGARQTAFVSYSSGTSGLSKAVMISHYNFIANVMQASVFDMVSREELGIDTQVSMGILPFSHIYGLCLLAHVAHYRGDELIVLPKFDIDTFCGAIQRFKIEQLSVVPPMLIHMMGNQDKCAKYDLKSVRLAVSAAAPLGREVVDNIRKTYPKWNINQAYGLTEVTGVCIATGETDPLFGSSGSLIPGVKATVVDSNGEEVTEYEKRGELWIQSPAVVLGYLNNEKANAETFIWREDGRWLKTGDEVLVRKSSKGNEHFVVVDRIKELIKVKGHQVAPAELEAHLLTHSFVNDCAVIPIQHDWAGEVPKAFIVKSKQASGKSAREVAESVQKHVEEHKAKYKWLQGGVEFIDVIPKSPSGKILRRLLRDKEKATQKEKGAKL